MEHVLCPELYARLKKVFGSVVIANHGEGARVETVVNAISGRPVTRVDASGEYYCVNCFKCHDTRHRLWINHRWTEFPWMAHCFNETKCLDGSEGRVNRATLRIMVFGSLAPPPKLPVAAAMAEPTASDPTALPDDFVLLSELPGDHPANTYLKRRGFDPAGLAREYGVGFCAEQPPEFRAATNRIIIPVFAGGELVRWQARRVGEFPVGFGGDPHPRYWNPRGSKLRSYLYNADAARGSEVVVVCEGVTDVWAVGPPAVALFSNAPTAEQYHQLIRDWGRGTLVVLLDGDAADEADKLARLLKPHFKKGTVVVDLPSGFDPGDLPREEVWTRIRAAARESGVPLPV